MDSRDWRVFVSCVQCGEVRDCAQSTPRLHFLQFLLKLNAEIASVVREAEPAAQRPVALFKPPEDAF
jgi:hypothetical protein